MIDDDWPEVRANLERRLAASWLGDESAFAHSLSSSASFDVSPTAGSVSTKSVGAERAAAHA